jgi:purine-binding chemotaxis protein CheW
MDFLKIREKAKAKAAEREAARATRARAGAAAPPQASEGPAADGAPPPAPEPVVTDADVLEGELSARLQGLPPAEDARFTTWRPGIGAPPVLPEAPPRPPARAEDFALVSVLGDGLAALPPPPEAEATPSPEPPPPAPLADPLDEFFYREDEAAPPVPLVGAEPGVAADAEPLATAREEFLTFFLADEEYAVDIGRVREVLKVPPLTEVPRAPRPVLGVVTVRGEVVAVFDPRARLGLPGAAPAEGAGRLVIVDAGDGPCGLLVDAVASVVRLRPGSIEPRPQGIGGAAAECLAGIGRQGGRLFTVLDLGAFFRRPAAPARPGDEEDRRVRT